MTLCPYCDEFQPTTRCLAPGCGGFVCPCSGRCNREGLYEHAGQAATASAAPAGTDAGLVPDARAEARRR